jgi:hypothetical protein
MQSGDEELASKLRQQKRWSLAVAVSISAVVGSGLLVVTLPTRFNPFLYCHHISPHVACTGNLRALDGAKHTWALENKKAGDAIPEDADLFGSDKYIREKPTCPSGGAYLIGRVSRKPRCTVPGHTI